MVTNKNIERIKEGEGGRTNMKVILESYKELLEDMPAELVKEARRITKLDEADAKMGDGDTTYPANAAGTDDIGE